MKTGSSLLLAVLLTAAQVHAADEGEKKKAAAEKKASQKKAAKKGTGSDKNVFQKAESNTGNFLHSNKIWTRQEKKN